MESVMERAPDRPLVELPAKPAFNLFGQLAAWIGTAVKAVVVGFTIVSAIALLVWGIAGLFSNGMTGRKPATRCWCGTSFSET
jgi:hypothetical protein